MPAPQLREPLQLLEQYALAENRSQATEKLSSQLEGKTAAFLAGASLLGAEPLEQYGSCTPAAYCGAI